MKKTTTSKLQLTIDFEFTSTAPVMATKPVISCTDSDFRQQQAIEEDLMSDRIGRQYDFRMSYVEHNRKVNESINRIWSQRYNLR